MNGSIRNISRALIFDSGYVLLAKDKVHGHAFLPGGGVEYGESLQDGLKRELWEEMGVEATVERAFGVFENSWAQKSFLHHELNFLFHVSLPGISFSKPISSLEDHLDFFWTPITGLDNLRFLPKELKPIIVRFIEKGSLDSFYSSNMIVPN